VINLRAAKRQRSSRSKGKNADKLEHSSGEESQSKNYKCTSKKALGKKSKAITYVSGRQGGRQRKEKKARSLPEKWTSRDRAGMEAAEESTISVEDLKGELKRKKTLVTADHPCKFFLTHKSFRGKKTHFFIDLTARSTEKKKITKPGAQNGEYLSAQ